MAGDTEAFGRLYHRHVERIRWLARWMLGTPDVGDAVQDAFIRAWRKLHLYRGEAAFGTWLGRLASNVFLRARARHARDDTRAGPLEGVADRPRYLDQRLDLEAAIDTLPERARLVFVLHEVQGYNHEEVARRLGITSPTSRSQLARARMLLRRHLHPEDPADD